MSGRRQILSITAPYCLALEKSVGAMIYQEREGERQYLLMRYPHGHWEFPRGHIESGETERETMYREIEEETAITKDDLSLEEGFRAQFSFSYRARGSEYKNRIKEKQCVFIHKRVIFYLARFVGHEVEISHEHTDFSWLSYDRAMERLTYTNARRILTQAEEKLTKV